MNKVNNSKFKLHTKEINEHNNGYIKDTDIFTWGLFLPKTDISIHVNDINNVIEQCVFKKGIIKLTAELYNK